MEAAAPNLEFDSGERFSLAIPPLRSDMGGIEIFKHCR